VVHGTPRLRHSSGPGLPRLRSTVKLQTILGDEELRGTERISGEGRPYAHTTVNRDFFAHAGVMRQAQTCAEAPRSRAL
jgi:hypothetical protein